MTMESSEVHRAALLLPEHMPGRTWWQTVYELAERHHLELETWVRDYAELMALIWSANAIELGVVPARAMMPPEPLIVMDDPPPDPGRPRWTQRRTL